MRFLLSISLVFISFSNWAQKPFTGKLTYTIEIVDTNLRKMIPSSQMIVYTNDTLIRIESTTDLLGQQVMIHHLQKNKSYLLVETSKGKFAIQIPEEQQNKELKYSYKKVKGKAKYLGYKTKNLTVKAVNLEQELQFKYIPSISAKYLPGFEHFPGLPVDYYTFTKDGFYRHQLKEINTLPVSKDLFGVSSDFKRISMDEFVSTVLNSPNK